MQPPGTTPPASARSPQEQELARASDELDQAERTVANLTAAAKRGEVVDDRELDHHRRVLEGLLAPDFRITRASGKVDDRKTFLRAVTSGDRRYHSHLTAVDAVSVHEGWGVALGSIETDGDSAGGPVRGRFRFTKTFARRPDGWQCVAWQNTPVPDRAPDAASVRALYEEVCRSHAGITDFRAKLLALLPLASGAGLLLLLDDASTSPDRLRYLLPFGTFGAVIALGLYFYELRGIQVCKALRVRGETLEKASLPASSALHGAFSGRPRARGSFVGVEAASHLIYSAVIAAWAYVAAVGYARGMPSGRAGILWPVVAVALTHLLTQGVSRLVDAGTSRGQRGP